MRNYPSRIFEDHFRRKTALLWRKQNFISSDQLTSILKASPEESTSATVAIRLLNFLLTLFAVTAFYSLLRRMIFGFHWGDPMSQAQFAISLAVFYYVIAEILARMRKFFRFGVEEALLIASGFFFVIGNWKLLRALDQTGWWISLDPLLCLIATLFSLWVYHRFGLIYFKLIGLVSTTAMIFTLQFDTFQFDLQLKRIIAFAFLTTLLVRSVQKKDLPDYEEASQSLFESTLALAAYLSVHLKLESLYSVPGLGHTFSAGNPEGPRSLFDWITFGLILLLPLVYLILGVRQRRRSFIISGIITTLLTLMTWKPYLGLERHLWDPMIFGAFLIAVSSFVSGWLSKGIGQMRAGFTAKNILSKEIYGKDLEALSSVAFIAAPDAASNPQQGFSGGASGGGGASQGY